MSSSEDDEIFWALAIGAGLAFAWEFLRAPFLGSIGAGQFAASAPALQTPLLDNLLPLHVSDQGRAFIQSNEGLRLTRYGDAGGYSIGYGHKIIPGDGIGQRITQAQASQLFDSDIAGVESTINDALGVSVTQGQYDALADFVYNVGAAAFRTSTLLRELNAGNYAAASAQFSRWIHSSGAVNPVLQQRRIADASLFNGVSA